MSTRDWYPTNRSGQLTMAKNWAQLLTDFGTKWKVPTDVLTALLQLITKVDGELEIASSERTKVSNARLKKAFDDMGAQMRDIKRRYFFIPPLSDADYIALGLQLKDDEPTPVGIPQGQAEAVIEYVGRGQLQLRIRHSEGTPVDTKSNYGFRIYYGAFGAGDTPPASGMDLNASRFSRQKKVLFTFLPTDSGKTAYFCIRYENSKGESGPWGLMVSAIIP